MSQVQTLLRINDISDCLKVAPSTIYRWMKEGRFPCGILLAKHTRVWRQSDLEAFLERAKG
jgi:predicted DNA-binding transcriptional regulator AlpA